MTISHVLFIPVYQMRCSHCPTAASGLTDLRSVFLLSSHPPNTPSAATHAVGPSWSEHKRYRCHPPEELCYRWEHRQPHPSSSLPASTIPVTISARLTPIGSFFPTFYLSNTLPHFTSKDAALKSDDLHFPLSKRIFFHPVCKMIRGAYALCCTLTYVQFSKTPEKNANGVFASTGIWSSHSTNVSFLFL